jgi:colanic acid biosynthesis glycosyl transferase WcaI
MRILLVCLNYAPEVVGIGPYNTGLSEYLASRGHQVSVLTSFPHYPHWRIDPGYKRKRPFLVEMINGVKVIRSPILLPGTRQNAFRRVLYDSSSSIGALITSMGVGQIDTVICISPPLQLGLAAWLIARSRGSRFLLHLQDLVPDAALSIGIMREGLAIGIARRMERFVYSRSDRITVISQGFEDNLACKGVALEKLHVLPNWVETRQFKGAQDPTIRAALGAADGETLILHTGNMGAKQGLETVVDAAAELANERIVMGLIGDGNSRTGLQAQAARLRLTNIRFLPLQSDFPATLAAADLLVLTQRRSMVDSVAPSKLLSYMASGKPVVAAVNDHSEAARMIRAANCGVVVPPEEPKALAAALRDLHRRPEDRKSLGDAGRRHVAAHYERSDVLAEWTKLIESGPRPPIERKAAPNK